MAEETKRPYTYDDATEFLEKEQLNEQMIVTDSEENGTCNIPVSFFAKAADLLYYEPVFDILESSTCEQVSTHMRANGKYLFRLFYNGDTYTYVKSTRNQYTQLHFVHFYLGTAKFAKVVLAGVQDDPVTIVPEFEEEIQKDIYELQNGLNDTIAQFGASVDDMLDQIDRIRTSVNTKVGEEATARTLEDARIEGLVSAEEQARINADVALGGRITELNTKVNTDIAKAIEDLEGSIAVEKARAEGVESTLNSAINGVEGKVDANTSNIVSLANSKADKTELDRVEGKVDGKADESDLNDLRYNVNRELDKKANTISVNAELNTLRESIDTKANANETYTKTQVDNKLALKANASDVTTALNEKANKSTTYTKTEVDNAVAPKADKTYVDDMLGNVEALLAAL